MSLVNNLDLLSVGIAIAGMAILGFIIFLSNSKSRTNQAFLLVSITGILWSLVNYLSYRVTNQWLALLTLRLVMFFAVWFAFSIYQLLTVFPEEEEGSGRFKKIKPLVPWITLIISILTLTPFIVARISEYADNGTALGFEKGPLIYLFGILVIFLLARGLFVLIRKTLKSSGKRFEQLGLVLIGIFITCFLIITFNFIFPAFLNNSSLIPFGAFFIIPFIALTAYSIARHGLLNIKVISTEVLVFVLAIITFFEVVLSSDITIIIYKGVEFGILLFFGLLLIRSVIKEVQQREEIEKLAVDLSKANDKLKVANEKLKELDRQKTEFVSIASHQLRSPLTAIKGYTSMLLEGSFGPIEEKAREAIDRVYESSLKLVTVIEDFLNITRIELGKMKYEISVFDLGALAQTVVKDQEPNVKKRGLTIEFQDGTGNHQISADSGKVTQVISNIIDNSIKYTPAGGVKIKVENLPAGKSKVKENVRITVSDTGVGIPKETLGKLFDKFVRADDAGKTNISGTGLGLYVAKQIV
ncbi:MAG: ATP-binding protein, partial [Candidatus Paceibacterota bacterium]